MSQERMDLLNDLGFAWNAYEVAWNLQLNNFKSFREKSGHGNVPAHDTKYRRLYIWTQDQRQCYALRKQGKKSTLTHARVEALDRIGFCWDPRKDLWSLRFQGLRKCMDKHGHCVIPAKNNTLRRWVSTQRSTYKTLKESKRLGMWEERFRALERIGFDWNE
jgi:hypothetical protein